MTRSAADWRGEHLFYFDHTTHEHMQHMLPLSFQDDFLGPYFEKYTTNENTTAKWKTTETNLNTGIALVDDAANGVVQITLDSDDNAEEGIIYWNDNLALNMDQGLIFEFRFSPHVLLTTGTEATYSCFGLAAAHNATIDSVTTNAWFRLMTGGDATLFWESDDTSTDDDDNDCGVEVVVDSWYICRIDCTDLSAVGFYVNGACVGTANMAAALTTAGKVQPYFRAGKAKAVASTGVGTLYFDYVRAWQERS